MEFSSTSPTHVATMPQTMPRVAKTEGMPRQPKAIASQTRQIVRRCLPGWEKESETPFLARTARSHSPAQLMEILGGILQGHNSVCFVQLDNRHWLLFWL